MKYCPHCNTLLTADVEVYTRPRKSRFESVEIIGCDNCVNTYWADEFFNEEELNEDGLRYMDDIWADMRAGIL